jgi:hypothetical protein
MVFPSTLLVFRSTSGGVEFYVGLRLRLRLLRYDSPDGVSSTVLVFMGTSGVEFYVASCSLGFCLPVARLRQETVRSSPTRYRTGTR